MAIAPNTRIGRYEIRSQLAKGGMGEVYLAFDTELDRTVAIKILPDVLAGDEQRLRRFIQEAKAASALNHPHILTIYEIGTAGASRFIATEFIDGNTLRQHIVDGLKLQEVLEIASQTVSALVAAHAAGIIHRDIKPDNIMVRRDGYVKILDFGLAKLTELPGPGPDTDAPTKAMVNTGAGMVMGTAAYMSPEQAKGVALDARTDLWSLGVVLYEMLTGKLPFAGETSTETISLIIQREPHPLSAYARDVPAELERIVSKALTKDPEERYQTAKDLLIDLRALKRKIEVDAEIDRTISPEVRAARSTGGGQGSFGTSTASIPSTLPATVSGVSSAEYILSGVRRHKVAAAIIGLVVLLGAIGGGYYYQTRQSAVAIESIAVLPFQNRGTETDTEYLSDGLAESLIYRLSQLPNLRVSPTSSVFAYRNKEIDPIAVGNQLRVNAVLSGRIVQRGDALTISAELVDVRQNKLLWGEHYDRKISDFLQTQREIAREIVDKLRLTVSPEERGLAKHYTESNDAYQLHLKGRFYWNKRTPDGFNKSLEYFQQAIDKDPNFALAYSSIAETYALLGAPEAGGGEMPPNEALPKAKAAALKALEIDASLAEPYVPLGHVAYYYDRDWARAEQNFRKAIELNPNYPVAHHWYAVFLSSLGRQSEALTEIKRAQDLDPLSLPINVWVGRVLAEAGQLDQAIEQFRKTAAMDPSFRMAHYRLGLAYLDKGMYDEAIKEFKEINNLSGGGLPSMGGLAQAYALAGKKGEAQRYLDELLAVSKKRWVSPALLASIYAALDNKDQAFFWLEEANKGHDLNIIRLKLDRRYANLRSDPRFDDLVRRIGIP